MDFGGAAVGVGNDNTSANIDLMSWYMNVPLITRLYLTGAFLTTAACTFEYISPYSLYFDWTLIYHGQVWRLISSYFYFGEFSIEFVFHMYFLIRYSCLLEEGDFRGRTANYVYMLLFAVVNISLIASCIDVQFLGSALTFMMTYIWGRRNEDIEMSLFGVLHFNAPYLPWIMLAYSVWMDHDVTTDLLGIAVGHLYYYLEYVYPVVAGVRKWRVNTIMEPPAALHLMCGSYHKQPPICCNVQSNGVSSE